MKAIVVGEAMVLTSSLSLEEIKTIQKYRPSALALMGGEDGKEEIFRISANEGGKPSISEYGIVFTAATTGEGLATVTTLIPGHAGDKWYVADVYGTAIINLGKLEESLADVLDSVQSERTALLDSITIQ